MEKIKQEIKQLRARLQQLEAQLETQLEKQLEAQPTIPNSWEECDKQGMYYISAHSEILKIHNRAIDIKTDRKLLPTKELAEAMLALCQLLVLRNETWKRDGNWQLDWSNDSIKHTISCSDNQIETDSWRGLHHILAFRTEQIRDEFLEKHRSLIEIAKPLL
jgi:hypothetical protein